MGWDPTDRPWRLTFRILEHEVCTESLPAPTDTAANKIPSRTAVLQTQVTRGFIRVTKQSLTEGSLIIYLLRTCCFMIRTLQSLKLRTEGYPSRHMKINVEVVLYNTQTNIKHTNKNKKHNTTHSSELYSVFLKGRFLFKFFLTNHLQAPNSY